MASQEFESPGGLGPFIREKETDRQEEEGFGGVCGGSIPATFLPLVGHPQQLGSREQK